MKNRKSYSRCPALLAVLTVCSTVLFLFSSCGSGNGKPSSVGSDDPADTYRGYLSEIRRLDHLTAKELAGHLKRWQTVKDSVFARLRRDTLGLPGSDACKVCEGIHDSLRIEFSRLALSGPRTYGELLMLKERLPTPRTRSCAARPKRFARFSPLWTAIRPVVTTGDRCFRPTGRCSPKASATASTAAMT